MFVHQSIDPCVDNAKFVDFCIRSTLVRSADEFVNLVSHHVSGLLEHEISICGVAGISVNGSYVHKVLHQNYPLGYFDDLCQPGGSVDSPLMTRWRKTREPVLFQSGRDESRFPPKWVKIFKKHDLRNTIGHGVVDVHGSMSTYFIFSRLSGDVTDRHALVLKLLVPHLHDALMRVVRTVADCTDFAGAVGALLSDRQRTILFGMREGKTNPEIARILNLTENNVNYHIDRILVKLSVRNRAQAVARAAELGLFGLPENYFPMET